MFLIDRALTNSLQVAEMQSPPSYQSVDSYPILTCAKKSILAEQPAMHAEQPAMHAEQPAMHAEQPAIFDMGFDRNLVERALQQFGGNMEQALEALISGRISLPGPPFPASRPPQVSHAHPAPHEEPRDSEEHVAARKQLLGVERVSDIREQLYIMLPTSARKAGWDTRSIQTALIVPSLGFSQGSPGERGVRLFDTIVGGKLSMHQLQQAETAALNALID